MPPEELFSTREAASYMDVSGSVIRQWVKDGKLVPTNKITTHNLTYLFKRKDIEKIQQQREARAERLRKKRKQ